MLVDQDNKYGAYGTRILADEMKLGSDDLISDETKSSTRNLLIAAVPVALVKFIQIPVHEVKVFEVSIPDGKIDQVMLLVLLGFMFSHLSNWVADFVAWRNWFRESRQAYLHHYGGKKHTVIEMAARTVRSFENHLEILSQELGIGYDHREEDKNHSDAFKKDRTDLIKEVKSIRIELETIRHTHIPLLVAHYKESKKRLNALHVASFWIVMVNQLFFPGSLAIFGITSILLDLYGTSA